MWNYRVSMNVIYTFQKMLGTLTLRLVHIFVWYLNHFDRTNDYFSFHFQDSAADECVEVQDKAFASMPTGYGMLLLRETFDYEWWIYLHTVDVVSLLQSVNYMCLITYFVKLFFQYTIDKKAIYYGLCGLKLDDMYRCMFPGYVSDVKLLGL